jgi:hypothetical protein
MREHVVVSRFRGAFAQGDAADGRRLSGEDLLAIVLQLSLVYRTVARSPAGFRTRPTRGRLEAEQLLHVW